MTGLSFSVVVNNFNYARFLPDAVGSALRQQAPGGVQVVVVDDGSSDQSLAYLATLEGPYDITIVRKSNEGQGSAYNAGWLRASGDIVIFLDADDVLYDDACTSIADAWQPSWAKCGYFLDTIDAEGRPLGTRLPRHLDHGRLVARLERFGTYLSPPGSGNAYSRSALERIMPIEEAEWRIGADSVPIMQSALFGQIGRVERSLGSYRVHGLASHATNGFNAPTLALRWTAACELEQKSLDSLRAFAPRAGFTLELPAAPRSPNSLTNRLAALAGRGRLFTLTGLRTAGDLVRSSLVHPRYKARERPALVLRAFARALKVDLTERHRQFSRRRQLTRASSRPDDRGSRGG